MVDLPVLEKIITGKKALLGYPSSMRIAFRLDSDNTLVMRSMEWLRLITLSSYHLIDLPKLNTMVGDLFGNFIDFGVVTLESRELFIEWEGISGLWLDIPSLMMDGIKLRTLSFSLTHTLKAKSMDRFDCGLLYQSVCHYHYDHHSLFKNNPIE